MLCFIANKKKFTTNVITKHIHCTSALVLDAFNRSFKSQIRSEIYSYGCSTSSLYWNLLIVHNIPYLKFAIRNALFIRILNGQPHYLPNLFFSYLSTKRPGKYDLEKLLTFENVYSPLFAPTPTIYSITVV